MTITDKELCACATHDPAGYLTLSDTARVARELLAARKVVRAVNRIPVCLDFPEICRAVAGYDKARKGKVT
jgi:hypothetical protein